MRNRATLHDVAVIGGQSHDVLAVFGQVQNLAAILDHVGYLEMIVRCRTTSHDTVRRRGLSYDICAIIFGRRRTILSMIVRRRKISSRIVRFTYVLASHQAIIVKSYVIVRLSYDYRTAVVRCRTIYLRFHRYDRCVANTSCPV